MLSSEESEFEELEDEESETERRGAIALINRLILLWIDLLLLVIVQ